MEELEEVLRGGGVAVEDVLRWRRRRRCCVEEVLRWRMCCGGGGGGGVAVVGDEAGLGATQHFRGGPVCILEQTISSVLCDV